MIEHLSEVFKDPVFSGFKITPERYVDYWLKKDCSVDNELLDFANELIVPCYLGTNQEELLIKHIINLVDDCFSGYFPSCSIGKAKPDPLFFEYIQNSLSLEPSDLLLIDDAKENVASARRCGWKGDLESLKSYLSETNLSEAG